MRSHRTPHTRTAWSEPPENSVSPSFSIHNTSPRCTAYSRANLPWNHLFTQAIGFIVVNQRKQSIENIIIKSWKLLQSNVAVNVADKQSVCVNTMTHDIDNMLWMIARHCRINYWHLQTHHHQFKTKNNEWKNRKEIRNKKKIVLII